MRKKLLLIWAILALLLIFTPCFAADLFYARDESSSAVASGATLNTGTALVTGSCFGRTLIVSQNYAATTTDDYLLIYDNTSATGTPKLDISFGVSRETVIVPLEDMQFGTGVFADAVETINSMHVTLIYSQ